MSDSTRKTCSISASGAGTQGGVRSAEAGVPDVSHPHDVVFLLDVDNTLLDNDRVEADLRRHMRDAFGAERQQCYWDLFEQLRAELGYADYLGALERYRAEYPRDPQLLHI